MDRQRQHNPDTGTLVATSGSPADSTQGKRTLVDAIAGGFGVGARVHTKPAAPHVAERELNAALKVVAFDADGSVIRTWGAKATWEGPLPQHFHGDHRSGTWRWDDAASARSVRVHTQVDGTGGESVESWAARLHATRVEIFAEPIDAVTERAARAEVDDPSAPGHADDVHNAPGHAGGKAHHAGGESDRVHPGGHGPGVDTSHGSHSATPASNATGSTPSDAAEHGSSATSGSSATPGDAGPDARLADVTAFERELGLELAQDEDAGDGDRDASPAPPGKNGSGGAGHEGGDPAGRTGKDASTTGQGPGGDTAKAGGDDEGSTSAARDGQGTKTGDRDGERHGAPNGRYAGEGRDGDEGVRGAGAIFGGVIAVPAALQGAVEIALLIDAGDITGAGADLFKAGVGKAMSVAAARRLVAREARIAAEHEMRAVVKQLASRKAFTALAKAEQDRVLRIVYWQKQRQFFRAYLNAARQEQRAIRQALKKARPAERVALDARQAAAHTGEEIAKVEPVAGQLPRNHAYAGHEFPRSQLPPKYRERGLRFKDTGYPDFEPYAMVLPNGQKKVKIALTGSRSADETAANAAVKLKRQPRGYTWHHNEDMETMSLVPTDLHNTVKHTGGTAGYKHRTGIDYVD